MASTIRTMNLVCEAFVVPVALRGASEKKDVSMGRALKLVQHIEGEEEPVVTYRKVRQLLVREPDEDAESLTIDPLRRDKKGEVSGVQFGEEVASGIWDGDTFIEIAGNDVDKIAEMTTVDDLVIQDFVALDDVPWERAMASYFLAPPSDAGQAALRHLVMLREAMEQKGVAGVAKLMPKSRQKLALIYPRHGGLMVTVLAYADTFRQVLEGAARMDGVEANPSVVEWMGKLIDAKSAPISVLDEYRDDLNDLRADLIDRAKLGQPLVEETDEDEDAVETPGFVGEDALMEKLRASVASLSKPPARKKTATAKKKTATKTTAQKKKSAASKAGGGGKRRQRPATV